MKAFLSALAMALAVFLGTRVDAQSSPPPNTSDAETGSAKPYQSFEGGGIDNINLANGNVTFNFPLVSYPQRGGVLRLSINIIYNSKPVQVRPYNSTGGEEWLPTQSGTYPVNPAIMDADFITTNSQTYQFTHLSKNYTAWIYSIQQADGTTHLMGSQSSLSSNYTPQPGAIFESLDATGWQLTSPAVPGAQGVVSPSGVRYISVDNVSREDANGNKITESHVGEVDTMGRVVPYLPQPGSQSTASLASCPSGPLSVAFAYAWNPPGPSGSSLSYVLCYAYVSNNIPANVVPGIPAYTANRLLLQSIVLPNSTSWKFEYSDRNSGDQSNINYGSLTKITLPTGGTITYTYTTRESGNCDLGSRWVSSRTLDANDGTGPKTTTYTWGSPGPVTVTDPLANQTVHTLGVVGSPINACSFVDKTVQYYQGTQGSGMLLKTVTTTYSGGNYFSMGYQQLGVFPVQKTTTWPSGQSVTENTTLDAGFTWYDPQNVQHTGMPYGVPVSVNEYDYTTGAPPGTTLLRQTNTSYVWQSGNPNAATYLKNNFIHLPYTIQVKDGSGNQLSLSQYNHDETSLASSGLTSSYQFDTAPPTGSFRGNTTSFYRWLNSGTLSCPNGHSGGSNGYVINRNTYFDDGMLNTSADPCGNTTTYSYSLSYWGALPTTVTNALNQTTTSAYDFNSSAITSTTDPNSQTTSKTYDVMLRPTQVNFPDGGSIKYCYTDMGGAGCSQSGPPYEVVTTQAITSSTNKVSTVVFDGLGRESQTQLNSDVPSTSYGVTTYDALGRESLVYNPTRCNPPTSNCGESTWGYTTANYDALNRITSVTKQDGSISSTNYSAFPCTTVTDEAGNTRQFCVDGLGRRTKVIEDPGPSPHLNYETDYSYDPLGNLLNVTQKGGTTDSGQWRTRTFTYDSLSRLLTANNPESGSIQYTYDPIGNLTTKTAPAPNQTGSATVTTTYSYDALNRLTQKSYSDGITPAIYFYYDVAPSWMSDLQHVVGRLANSSNQYAGSITPQTTANTYSYDTMGRLIRRWEQTPSTALGGNFVYSTYDVAGDLTSTTTASGTTLSFAYDGATHLTQITSNLVDSQHPATLWTANSYYPHGAVQKAIFGNGLTEAYLYEPRLQPCRIDLNSSGVLQGTCDDTLPSGTIQHYHYTFGGWGTSNNGNVTNIVGSSTQNFNRSYGYDSLNRLISMSAPGDLCSGLSWATTHGVTA